MQEAEDLLDEELKSAIRLAKQNIETFHAAQRFTSKRVETQPGVTCWQKAVPIERVGLYIPGGTAPLFSTVLMLAVPARIAGCGEIVLCTPPGMNGKVHPAVLFAAQVAGVNRLFKAGGVQAIASMAYGTESVPRVYKIFGPGNQYVTAAKQLVSLRDVAIDMPAGPSEVEVLADDTANPAFVAADLLSQAEHGVDSQALLVTTSPVLCQAVQQEVERQLALLPRKEIAARSLEHSKLIVVRDMDEALALTNAYAPEHLIIQTADYMQVAERVMNAGSVFLGPYSTESAGDYASGTNHTLPTNGYARAYSGVSLDSFIRKITFQEITAEGIRAVRYFADRGIRTNCTLVFSVGQALLAAKAGATYVSPFVGRLDDICSDGIDLIRKIVDMYAYYGFKTQVLAASIRHTNHIIRCLDILAEYNRIHAA